MTHPLSGFTGSVSAQRQTDRHYGFPFFRQAIAALAVFGLMPRASGQSSGQMRNLLPTLPLGFPFEGPSDGTSMAAPQVTAVAAQLKAAYPHLSPAAIRCIIGSTGYGKDSTLDYLAALKLASEYQPGDTERLCPSTTLATAARRLSASASTQHDLAHYQIHIPVAVTAEIATALRTRGIHVDPNAQEAVLTPSGCIVQTKVDEPALSTALHRQLNQAGIKAHFIIQQIMYGMYAIQINHEEGTSTDAAKQQLQIVLSACQQIAGVTHVDVNAIVMTDRHVRSSSEQTASPSTAPTSAPTYAPSTVDDTCEDPSRAMQWHLDSTENYGIGVDAAERWMREHGIPSVTDAGIVIAVVDTGEIEHPDLKGVFYPGFDFTTNTTDATDNGLLTHGAHVAGTIAQRSCNDISGRGVLRNPEGSKGPILSVKVLTDVGLLGGGSGTVADILPGILWAAGVEVAGAPKNLYPAQVINLSLGSAQACTPAWQTVIDKVVALGVTVVAAAGNSNQDVSGFSPAGCEQVIAVGATNSTGKPASFSNWGNAKFPDPGSITSSAPGVGIIGPLAYDGGSTTFAPTPAPAPFTTWAPTFLTTGAPNTPAPTWWGLPSPTPEPTPMPTSPSNHQHTLGGIVLGSLGAAAGLLFLTVMATKRYQEHRQPPQQ
jgi:hypothetical protein